MMISLYSKFMIISKGHIRCLACWRCKRPISERPGVFCSSCRVIQPLKTDQTFFDYFGLNKDFSIDHNDLKNKFRTVQTQVHPDKFARNTEKERKFAVVHSSFANQAYTTLSDAKKRALYLLELTNTDEGNTDPEFAMEILEMNEEIEQNDDHQWLEKKLTEIENEIQRLMEVITEDFEKGKNEEAREALNRMRYFDRSKKLVKIKLGHLV